MKIILASTSLRRKQLLKNIVEDFEVISKDVDETLKKELSLDDALKDLALRKAEAVFKENQDSIVIGSDTIVLLEQEILGKPENRESAIETLKKLSGKCHQVKTSVAIISKHDKISFVATCDVEFDILNLEEITKYVDSGEAYNKAGSYGIQGLASKFIKKINGDYYTVVGLPINLLYNHLKKFL